MRKTVLIPMLAAGALVLSGCGGEDDSSDTGAPPASDGAGDDGAATGGGEDDGGEGGDSPGGEDPGAGGDQREPGEKPDESVFHERAEQIAADWPSAQPAEASSPVLWAVEGVIDAEPGDTELTVVIGHGDCDAEWGSWVHETDDLVILGGWSVEDTDVEVCNEMLAVDEVEVELENELGDRTLVDAMTAQEPTPMQPDEG
ncbi:MULTISPECIES: hypothetical protein [unclassified Streptomyces]|uniref:hypothetical protein n=1 Tax=unclassified Streptomyces TaxID=2593676 RepID=UPI000CD4F7A0|nr:MULTISPECIES: hypothetical protein [unclassified Streptomyces]